MPLVLFHFEQQSYQEIASTLGISVGKVKTDIHRGRETLRKDMTSQQVRRQKVRNEESRQNVRSF